MKLKYKLTIFTVFALLVPMAVLSFYAGVLVYRNISLAQWNFLQVVSENVEELIRQEQESYQAKIEEVSENKYISDKLYVYSKYWDRISPATLEFDLYPFRDFIENNIMFSNIESVLIFRIHEEKFIRLVGRGLTANLPETVYPADVKDYYSRPQYYRSADGIYLRFYRPIFSSGRMVGLIMLQKGLNAGFMSSLATRFNVEAALVTDSGFLFNSRPETMEPLSELLMEKNGEVRIVFSSKQTTYHGFVLPFDLGNKVTGTLILYVPSENAIHQSSMIIRDISVVAFICLLIPVVIFVFWGTGLVRAIHHFLKAADIVANGNLDHQVQATSKDEIGQLGRNFNDMVQKLKISRTALENRNTELRIKNTYIDAVFQSLLINIIVIDAADTIVVMNKSAESRIDFPENPVGVNLFCIPQFASARLELSNALDETKRTNASLRVPEMDFGGDAYEVDMYPVVLENIAESVIVMVMLNITEKMETKKALIRSERLAAVGQITAGLAHEINNPMGIILNHVQLIESGKLSEAERKKFAARVKSEIMRVSKLIEKLLSFSKEESGPLKFDYLSIIAGDVLDFFEPGANNATDSGKPCTVREGSSLVGLWTVVFKELSIRVCLSRHANETPVFCDRNAMKQVFINLLSNSFKSIHHDFGMIHINVHSQEDGVAVSLQDNGEGIPPMYMDRIFDPFFTMEHESGTGLGLPLCQKIIKNHGGSIHVTSNGIRGTEVIFFIPSKETIDG